MTDLPITTASAATLAGEAGARVALLFGGSGQIGERLLQGLLAAGWQVHAFSRTPQSPRGGLHWHLGELSQLQAPPVQAEAIFSCGPLDAFADWYRRTPLHARRVVAFGSTSLEVKRDSLDAAERDVARRLREAEVALFASAAERGAAATVLRPTLVYGAGRDRTLSAIAALAQRSGWFVLPHSARGLRQPVHVHDLADAALAVLGHPATHGRSYALGGGEVLSYREMVQRVLAALQPPARLLLLPHAVFAVALRIAHAGGRLRGMNRAALQRMGDDLVFDLAPAQRDFGYAPRAFAPDAAMLGVEL
ncbi:SDR family oxidoreductase [Xanthomonas translucens]|uniref:Nucleoside-diphosphate sugar epimerase n=8 Tax=Xanthomonas campestris pv. translucens TaxID=343 RepID=A0A109HFY8_XANCT|nr:NAD-dependent epimerase/dehydratase family protein [Xanthomonas translucens]KTF41168.1 nucleoside-diphosphate sugar epimerase [Xanthomonas translucens pv. translucens]KWV11415.1 nucleoside-diphosphate sugar epimerase [Xanthomonas translucens]MCS3361221.1 NAD-dependent epimerase/dehydratase family protein [Xanthomonas translucens pv. translucens]MCS3374978.1 NAD-dependent epimerase/dehydratase family protein [Xanthomonas translucens pv. translucens]MCT8275914.1 NAD-dependent epimerase/dehydr